ncbi:MAG TPA: hypothetical protein VK581_08800 [Chthoniobacterales bacterium]|nr:hypothetical protein [Chthoniobacterales bacterium]
MKAFNARGATSKSQTFEDMLAADLREEPNAPMDLIVADRDLSAYQPHYRGLSESTVRRAADLIGIPECGYARGERDDDDEYVKRGDQRESCIRLSRKPNDATFAKRVVAICEGFIEITTKLAQITDTTVRKSPGRILAEVLGKPEYAEKISLYASGDQSRLAPLAEVRKSVSPEERNRRLACVLGYWLWDSVLRFPGVTVNEVAASSHLNIRLDTFRQQAVKELFASALYVGPFSAARLGALWWRGMLDDLVSDSGFSDGRTFAEDKLARSVPASQCCEEPSKPAGYYCFLSEQPVSLENSKPGLPWFPRGADLTRVSRSRYEEDEPWL